MNNPIKQKYQLLNEQFSKLTMREKSSILLASIGLVLFLGITLFVQPAWQKLNEDNLKNQATQKRLASLDRQIVQLEKKLKEDPNAPLRQRLKRLAQEDNKLENRLDALTSDLVPANRMTKLLENLLAKSSDLKLITLESLPPKFLQASQTPNEDNATNLGLYQHGVKLVLEGGYFPLLQYLESIEESKWQFYWKGFDYQVSEYPLATLELEVYTLSRSEAFIGV